MLLFFLLLFLFNPLPYFTPTIAMSQRICFREQLATWHTLNGPRAQLLLILFASNGLGICERLNSLVCNLPDSGEDPARKFRGAISVIFGSKSQLAVKCLSELYKIMVKKVTFVGFRGGDRPNRLPPGSTPGQIE